MTQPKVLGQLDASSTLSSSFGMQRADFFKKSHITSPLLWCVQVKSSFYWWEPDATFLSRLGVQ